MLIDRVFCVLANPPEKKTEDAMRNCMICEEQEWAPTTTALRPRLSDSYGPWTILQVR